MSHAHLSSLGFHDGDFRDKPSNEGRGLSGQWVDKDVLCVLVLVLCSNNNSLMLCRSGLYCVFKGNGLCTFESGYPW